MNRYVIKTNNIDDTEELKISQYNFDNLKESSQVLSNALAIEEKYQIVINNFLDLEKESLSLSLNEMVKSSFNYEDFFYMRLNLNTRLVNLLTSVRLYNDQLKNHIALCFSSEINIGDEIQRIISEEYDSHFEYRFMEALRNYTQHSGIPVHRTISGPSRNHADTSQIEFTLYFSTQRELLLQDNNFKKQVLNEMPEEVDLKLTTRAYIESISRIHSKARTRISNIVEKSRLLFDQTIQEYRNLTHKTPFALYAFKYEHEKQVDDVLIFTKWDDIRIELSLRNKELKNLRNRHISSIITKKNNHADN